MGFIRYYKLGTWPVPKLVVHLALPAILAQIIDVLYNIVDRIYLLSQQEYYVTCSHHLNAIILKWGLPVQYS
ncbi:hypothetical protein M2454_003006 [Aequitasia blattaphilus]|uniref:Uncharacterized protein n=1 Tax=Aequitasia blattaphilus TaxID=2949332 RepID=A0ABT1ECU7_9FIRM|nr:hypothetical protein [Aequitasia blattaphilus]MCP1103666.1 hypothetical protein [Aequitasia blattaphilus]MCR8616306.1 hypothetical protein [Aequitasia blattaphilus]